MPVPLTRLIVVLWALAVAAMPGALAVADARLETLSAAEVHPHVEALGGTGCAAVHDAECAICSSLRLLTGSVAVDGCIGTPAARAGAMPVSDPALGASTLAWLGRQPRAPPAV